MDDHKLDREFRAALKQFITAREDIFTRMCERAWSLCESPIEKLLVPHLLTVETVMGSTCQAMPANSTPEQHIETLKILPEGWMLKPQAVIAPWRVDFLCQLIDHGGAIKSIVIECDGHDYHERTKEQAAHDRKRDRDLTARGFTVLRFTGSEIYKSPAKCAADVAAVFHEAWYPTTVQVVNG